MYNGYQLNMKNVPQEVSEVLQQYQRKYGQPPEILETSLPELPLPDGMSLVVRRHELPKNIILIVVPEKEYENN